MDDKSSSHCLSIASRVGWASCKIGWMAYITSSPYWSRSGPEEKLSNEQLPTYVPSLAVRHHNDSCGLSSHGPVENVWSCVRKSFCLFFPQWITWLGRVFSFQKKKPGFFHENSHQLRCLTSTNMAFCFGGMSRFFWNLRWRLASGCAQSVWVPPSWCWPWAWRAQKYYYSCRFMERCCEKFGVILYKFSFCDFLVFCDDFFFGGSGMGWRFLRFLRHDNEAMERCPPRSKFFGKCLGGSLRTRVGGWPRYVKSWDFRRGSFLKKKTSFPRCFAASVLFFIFWLCRLVRTPTTDGWFYDLYTYCWWFRNPAPPGMYKTL